MMLAHPRLDTVFSFEIDRINTLVIEDPAFYRIFLQDIDGQLQGFPGQAVLSEKDVPVDFGKNAELIDSFLSFSISRKQLVTKVLNRPEARAMDESHYVQTAKFTTELEKYVMELAFDLPCDIFCSKINFAGILRTVGVEIRDDYHNDLERLADYMELTRELERDKLFIFAGMRSFYGDEDVELFLATACAHGYRVFPVDNVSRNILPHEKRVTVDSDLCEF